MSGARVLVILCAASSGFGIRGALQAAADGNAGNALARGLLAALNLALALYWSRDAEQATR